MMPTVRYLHWRPLVCTCFGIHTRLLRNGAAAKKRTQRLRARILVAKSAESAATAAAKLATCFAKTKDVLLALCKAYFWVVVALKARLHLSDNALHFGDADGIHLAEEFVGKRALYFIARRHRAVCGGILFGSKRVKKDDPTKIDSRLCRLIGREKEHTEDTGTVLVFLSLQAPGPFVTPAFLTFASHAQHICADMQQAEQLTLITQAQVVHIGGVTDARN